MKFLKTRIATIIITAIVVLALGTGVAFAAGVFTKPLPVTAKIVAAIPDLSFYADSTLSTPITTLNFGDIIQGTTVFKNIYIRNTGTKAVSGLSASIDADPGVMTATVVFDNTILAKNASTKVAFTVTASETATLGDITPNVIFNGSY